MQNTELYVIMLRTAEGAEPQRVCCIDEGGGGPLLRETPNCWYVSDPPQGLPERFRKSEEYKLLNNRFGIYMFVRDSMELEVSCNVSTSVQLQNRL